MYKNIYCERTLSDTPRSYIHIWDDELGYKKVMHKKYGYKLDPDGEYLTLNNNPCKKVTFWKHEDLENGYIYEGDIHPEVRYLVDNYTDEDNISTGHRTLFFDIEVDSRNTPPKADTALNTITSIGFYDTFFGEYWVYLLDPDNELADDVIIKDSLVTNLKVFDTEQEMLASFVDYFIKLQPTIITNWYGDMFDIPYLIHRLDLLFGENFHKLLSPVHIVEFNEYQNRYYIAGISCLDYMALYKKFDPSGRESFSLDFISMLELGEGKIKYDGSLNKLYKEDKQKFIEYNINDVVLIKKLDDKLQYINLTMGICHKCHVKYEDIFFSSRYIDGAILTYLKRKGRIAPSKPQSDYTLDKRDRDKFAGAYVKEPVPGLYKWLIDIDATSLYPSVIRTLNISPETKYFKIKNWDEIVLRYSKNGMVNLNSTSVPDSQILELDFGNDNIMPVTKDNFIEFVKTDNFSVSQNGIGYNNDRVNSEGIIPEILGIWFNERVEYSKKASEYKFGSADYVRYDRLQHVQKILLNSVYGVLGLKAFRYYDLDNAESVTKTGVALIKLSEKLVNKFLNTKCSTDGINYVIYIDTDSNFIEVHSVLKALYPDLDYGDSNAVAEKVLLLASELQTYVNSMLLKFANNVLFTDTNFFTMKQELVAKSGIFTAKKRYALALINKKGKMVNELEIKGLDVVKSSFPKLFRNFMKQMIRDILDMKDKEYVDNSVLGVRAVLDDERIPDIARTTSVNEISKYSKNTHQPFNFKVLHTPVHVKASINYNDFLRHNKLDTKYKLIGDGEKIKWVYLKNNPYRISNMAFRNNEEDAPEIIEFISEYIDRSKVFKSDMSEKLQVFYNALGWGLIPTEKFTDLLDFLT